MKIRLISLITLAAFALGGITGCGTIPKEHEGAAKGAGYGGAAGALAGALLAGEGSRTKGAVLGGLAGVLIGGVIGNYTIDKKLTAEETAAKYNVQPSSGTMVRLENVTTTPSSVNPGDRVEVQTTYALLTPSTTEQVGLTESVEIYHGGELVGNPEAMVTHSGGTYTFTIPIVLPKDAKAGSYRVISTVKTATAKDSRETSFTVR